MQQNTISNLKTPPSSFRSTHRVKNRLQNRSFSIADDTGISIALDHARSGVVPVRGLDLDTKIDGLLTKKSIEDLESFVANLTQDKRFASKFIEIIETETFKNLAGKFQMTARTTEIGASETSTRYIHSIHSAKLFIEFSKKIGLNLETTKFTAILMLIHDIGHGPFSHTFELALNKNPQIHYDHDSFGAQLLQTEDLKVKIIQALNPQKDPALAKKIIPMLSDILKEQKQPELQFFIEIKNIFDRASYLVQDIERSQFTTEEKDRDIKSVYDFLDSLSYNKELDRIVSSNKALAEDFLNLRQKLNQRMCEHPAVNIANEYISIFINQYLEENSLLSPCDLFQLHRISEKEILGYLPVRFSELFNKKVERLFEPVITIPFTYFTSDGLTEILEDRVSDKILNKVLEDPRFANLNLSIEVLRENLIIAHTGNYSKDWDIAVQEETGETQVHTLRRRVSHNDSFLVVALRKNHFIRYDSLKSLNQIVLEAVKELCQVDSKEDLQTKFRKLTRNAFRIYTYDQNGKFLTPS